MIRTFAMIVMTFQVLLVPVAFAQEACGSFFTNDAGKAEAYQEIYENEIITEEIGGAISNITGYPFIDNTSNATYLTDAGIFVWRLYVGTEYTIINSPLRKQTGITKAHRIVYTLMTKFLDTVPVTMQPLYRWGRFSPEKIQSFQKGKIVRFNSFLSTTKVSDGFSTIPSKKRDAVKFIFMTHKGAYDINSIASWEAEVIFKPGTHFRIKRVDGLKIFLEEVTPVYRPDIEARAEQPQAKAA